jgi:hypothetical protein
LPILWFVSQISPPVRILLIGAVVFLAAWFTLLRPKGETAVPPVTTAATPAATPQTGLGKAVDAARKVAGKAAATATPATGTAAGQATTSAPDKKAEAAPVAAIPAETLAKLPKDVAGALKARKVLVLGVLSTEAKPWRPLSDDDRYVRNTLKRVNRYDGHVFVKRVALDKLSTYGPLVNELGVSQSPSIVVIDRDLKGSVLTGYVDKVSINQVIADARRNSIEPDIKDAYLRHANEVCGDFSLVESRWSRPTIRGDKAAIAALERHAALVSTYAAQVAALHPPAKWRTLHRAWLQDAGAQKTAASAIVTAAKSGKSAKVNAAIDTYNRTWSRSLDRRFNDAGVTNCVVNRTS